MKQTLERRFSDLKINEREEIGLGRLERLMGKFQDYLLDLDDESFYLSWHQINNLLEDIKELIKNTNLEQIDHRYARVLRAIGRYYTPGEPVFDDYKKASIAYELSLKIDPDNEYVWRRLANAYRVLNEFDKAKRFYKRALEINPPSITTGGSLASLYRLLDEYEEERKTYEYILKHNPEEFSCWSELGKAYNNCGQYHKAIDAFKRHSEKNPIGYDNLNELCYSYIKLGDFNKAEEIINKALKKRKNITTLTNLSLIYQDRGNIDKVNELYKEIIELEPRSLRDIKNLVKIHIKMNQFDKAREIITHIESSPSYRGTLMSKLRKKIELKQLAM